MKRSVNRCLSHFALLSVCLFLGACHVRNQAAAQESSGGIPVQGPGVAPHLAFACCDQSVEQMQALFAQPGVVSVLKELHATVAVPTLDFSPQRADVVRLLNQQGVPVVGWIVLSSEQGSFLTADNVSQAASRVAGFEKWTSDHDLKWVAVGLDIEPNFVELAQLRNHRWRLIATLLRRSLNGGRIVRARQAYSTLIDEIRSRGYPVQIYQMPYIPEERSMHSSLPDRLLGTVDVRGDQDYVMLYTSFARPVGAGMIWSLGPHAQDIAIGSTDGDAPPGIAGGPLDWNEFSRDLIVASHFTRQIGVYDLEGCVRQGFLPRLLTMNWSQSVIIPAESVRRAARLGFIVRSVLWIDSNLIYLLTTGLLLIGWLLWRRSIRKKTREDRR
jgi:hypothetical protein